MGGGGTPPASFQVEKYYFFDSEGVDRPAECLLEDRRESLQAVPGQTEADEAGLEAGEAEVEALVEGVVSEVQAEEAGQPCEDVGVEVLYEVVGQLQVGQVGQAGQGGGEAGQEVGREVEVAQAGGEGGQAGVGQGEQLAGHQVELREIFKIFFYSKYFGVVTSCTRVEGENRPSGRKEMFDWEMKTPGSERFLCSLRLFVTSARSVLRQERPELEISQPPPVTQSQLWLKLSRRKWSAGSDVRRCVNNLNSTLNDRTAFLFSHSKLYICCQFLSHNSFCS